MAARLEIHNRSIEKRLATLRSWKIASEDKRALVTFINDLELGKVSRGCKISESRRVKYLDVLRTPLEFFGNPTSRLILKDIERFEKALSSGTLISSRGGAYAHSSRVDIRRALRVYLKWKLGVRRATALTGWFDTRQVVKTPDFLKENEIERLLKACKSAEERFLVTILFDSGARASEFHNIRFGDIELPAGNKNYVRLTLKEEYSKTKGRTISLYWKHTLEAVRDYLTERSAAGIRSEDPVFERSYTAVRLFLRRLGKKVLGRSIHYHLFRHSSATYYADKMNRQQLCIRYGWTFSSNMPDVYISRAGVDSQELDEKFTSTTVETLQQRLVKKEQEDQLKDDRIKMLENEITGMRQTYNLLVSALGLNPTLAEAEAALKHKKLNLTTSLNGKTIPRTK
jgi:integrase